MTARREVGERAIQSLPEEKAIAYDKSVFIKKLLVAGITETMAARHQFFNAEIMYREIHDKGDPEEITNDKFGSKNMDNMVAKVPEGNR